MSKTTYCPCCAQKITTPVVTTKFTERIGTCPNCATQFDPDWVRIISHKEAAKIIEERRPMGKFIVESREGHEPFTGIDNTTDLGGVGDARTEDFEDAEACIRWLADPNADADELREVREFKVPVIWSMMGYVYVEATDPESAMRQVSTHPEAFSLPTNGEYLEDSFQVDEEGDPLPVL